MKRNFLIVSCLVTANFILNAQPTYKDVAAIFYARCTSCHNQATIGPSFLTYNSTKPWANIMQVKLTSNAMPPWTPDTTYTRFIHENKIMPSEKTAILNWIAAGAPAGDTSSLPKPPVYGQYKLSGSPDIELQIPTFTSNAWSSDSYVCFSLPLGLAQDRILRAYEIVAGSPQIVHHVVVNVDTNGTTNSDLSGGCFNITGDFSIGGFAPGTPPTVFPGDPTLKMGIRIRAGSKLVMQIHYPVGTAGLVDSTKIRLFFYPPGTAGIRPVFVTTPLQNWNLNIPANSSSTFTAQYPGAAGLPYNISVFSAFPHSHKSATSIVNYAYKGTDTIRLIRINGWQFDQQGYYTFKNMRKIPATYRLYSKHAYFNPGNTPIYAGPNTTDEMLFDSFQWLTYQAGDELIDVESILKEDTLLKNTTGISQIPAPISMKHEAYPNPFTKEVTVSFDLVKPGKVSLDIYTVDGRLIRSLIQNCSLSGVNEVVWDGRNEKGIRLEGGAYFYELAGGSRIYSGKMILLGQ